MVEGHEIEPELPDADPDLPEIPDPGSEPAAAVPRHGLTRRAVRLLVPLLIAGGMVWVALSSAGGFANSLDLVKGARFRWVAAALGSEMVSYVALSLHLRHLGGPRDNVRRLAPFRLALVLFGLGEVLPAAPAEGLVMAGAALRRRRLAKARTVLVLGISHSFRTASLFAVAAVNTLLVLTLTRLPVPDRALVLIASAGALGCLVLLAWLCAKPSVAELAALVADRVRFWKASPPDSETKERGAAWHAAVMHLVSGPGGLAYLTATTALAWMADAGCLQFALLAFGVHVSPQVLLFAYTAGALASMVPLLPAGLGIVETVTPAVLHLADVPLVVALAAIVVYRLLSTLLPAVAGALGLIGMRVEPPSEEPILEASTNSAEPPAPDIAPPKPIPEVFRQPTLRMPVSEVARRPSAPPTSAPARRGPAVGRITPPGPLHGR